MRVIHIDSLTDEAKREYFAAPFVKPSKIELRETTREPFEKEPRYDVVFRGEVFDTLYFNLTGYRGYLPSPGEGGKVGRLDIGERGISAYRKEVAKLNREWEKFPVPIATS